MLAEGCIMVRACHRDTCPTGIATQRPEPAGEVRGHARGRRHVHGVRRRGGARSCSRRSGCASLDEAIGRVELLRQRRHRRRARRRRSTSSPLLATARRRPTRRAGSCSTSPIQRPRSALDAQLLEDGVRRAVGGRRASSSSTRSPTPTAPSARRSAARSASSSASRCRPGTVTARFTGRGRAELRRVPRRRRHARAHRRGQRLRRQGDGRRPDRDARRPPTTPATRCSPATPCCTARPAGSCSSPVAVGRALLRAQQRRDRRGRGHRRPRLRVHDRRHAS